MLKITDEAYLLLVEEKTNLEKKVDVLEDYVKKARLGEAPPEHNLTHFELELLEEQLHYMRGYLRTLICRLSNVKS